MENCPGAVPLEGRAEGNILLQNVNFEYAPDTPVLEEINLDIRAHQVVALVGPTGVGKSTLVSLIPRFYDVSSGCITLDGTDIRQYTLEVLRRQISIVLQDVFLFHGTVRENILFGRPNASEQEVIAAARIANADDFIIGSIRRLRYADRRARSEAFGRSETAPVHRPRRAQGCAHPDPG